LEQATMPDVRIFSDTHTLAAAAAQLWVAAAQAAIRERGLFSVALAGGSTPLMLYHLLAGPDYTHKVEWDRVHFFWGDERCVPPDHDDNNAFKARQALLDHISTPAANIHPILTQHKPEAAAAMYEETLLAFFSSLPAPAEPEPPTFDMVLLGMGDDGHTASLFPGSPAVHETARWVTAQYVDKLAAWRISLTPAVFNRARAVLLLVSGAGKSATLQRVLYGSYQPDRYPAQVIQPVRGEPAWLVDEAAASLL
jgi:6-phosphogluconolactonase